jgi:hypothetical protein
MKRPRVSSRRRRVLLGVEALEGRRVLSGAGELPEQATGLLGQYFDDPNLQDEVLRRVDATVDFDWHGSPAPRVGSDDFSVRWSGQVQARFSQDYTFTATSEGARLWVDGHEVIDDWNNHAPHSDSGSVALQAGHKYDLVLEFAHQTGPALARLTWSSADQKPEVIPSTQLSPTRNSGQPPGPKQTVQPEDSLPLTIVQPLLLLPRSEGSLAAALASTPPVIPGPNQTSPVFSAPTVPNNLPAVGGSADPFAEIAHIAAAPSPVLPTSMPTHPADVHPSAEEAVGEEEARATPGETRGDATDAAFAGRGWMVKGEDFGERGRAMRWEQGERPVCGAERWLATVWLAGSLSAGEERGRVGVRG